MTFEFQSTLSRLPIPTLNETLKRYLKSVEPLLEKGEYAKYCEIVFDFLNGQGAVLQERLVAHDKTQKFSWLESWWLSLAYLTWREAVLINSNWYIIVQKHPYYGEWNHAVKRASGFISNFLDFKHRLDSETFPADRVKNGYLCMDQYRKMFGITRVPKTGEDELVMAKDSRHIIVLIKDQIYAVDVYGKDGARVSIDLIQGQLAKVFQLEEGRRGAEPPIGLFTGVHRDTWARIYEYMLRLDNLAAFEIIQGALFAVSFDDKESHSVDSLAKNVFHGYNGRNMWFDKSLSIVVSKDGMIGLNGEHSPCDALVPAILVDYAVQNEPAKDPKNCLMVADMAEPKKIKWKIDKTVEKSLEEAQVFVDKLIADSDLGILHYENYGSDWIKKNGQVSPDAFVQICLQLTYFRIHRKLAPTYETASVRKYLHGRTETCRSLSQEMADFVTVFDNPHVNAAQKLSLFRKAAEAHVEYLQAASNGFGVDRHLLGLRLVMRPNEVKHPIFTHPVFAKSSQWILSTSALFSGERTLGTGFGAVEHSGYGMNYLIGKGIIKVGIESKTSCAETKTCKFRSTLRGVFSDMQTFIENSKTTKL